MEKYGKAFHNFAEQAQDSFFVLYFYFQISKLVTDVSILETYLSHVLFSPVVSEGNTFVSFFFKIKKKGYKMLYTNGFC